MKIITNKVHSLVLLLLLIIFAAPVIAQHQHMAMNMPAKSTERKNIFINMMDTMMQNMDTVTIRQNADLDFIRMMIPHHQGAIEMAQYEIIHGANFEMKQLAKSIIAEQANEIVQMNLWLKTDGLADLKYNNEHEKPLMLTMTVMMNDMPASTTLTQLDKSFAAVMIPHHQAGVDMAKVILQYGSDKIVARIAENIISSQQVEIEQMKSFLNK